MFSEMFVSRMSVIDTIENCGAYFAKLGAVRALRERGGLEFASPVTFFVGENGSGKSTLLEALAVGCGFNAEGGTRNFNFATAQTHSGLHQYLRVGRGIHRPKDGFFLRAESYYNVATEIERLDEIRPVLDYYGGVSPHQLSHGESFMALVQNRFGKQGLFLLDEPEAALSPARQMALLRELNRLVALGGQFVIATHSPILMAYPAADIYVFDGDAIEKTNYTETEHYLLTRRFVTDYERMIALLFED